MTSPVWKKAPFTVDFFQPGKMGASVSAPPTASSETLFQSSSPPNGLHSIQKFSFNALFSLRTAAGAAPVTWLDSLAQLAGAIEAMDLDFFELPANRGTGLCRFPEYTPRASRPEACTVSIFPNTKARVHGEIRPIRGSQESLLTRFTVDYNPNVYSLLKYLPNLEIDGFAAVDSSEMSFDTRFLERDKSVTSVHGGDFDYENPLARSLNLVTPFDSQADAPPNGHRDWMFRFMPVDKTAFAAVEESVANGRGSLILWAYLPTVGLQTPENFEKLGIRYNTFPRRAEDLVRFLSPLFDPAQSAALKSAAPYINPNSEYIDGQGKRRKIPEDAAEVAKLNEERKQQGLPLLGRNRGTILDWIFTDLAKDPDRFAGLKPQDWPRASGRVRFRDTALKLPFGEIQLRRATDLRFEYRFAAAPDASGKLEPRLAFHGKMEPLSLGEIDLKVAGVHLKAKALTAAQIDFEVGHLPTLVKNSSTQAFPLTWRLKGVKVEGLSLEDPSGMLQLTMPRAELGEVTLTQSKSGWSLEIDGLKAETLKLSSPIGELTVQQAEIPAESDPKVPQKIRIAQTSDTLGKTASFSVELPEIFSAGGFSIGEASGTGLEMEGLSRLSRIRFSKKEGPDNADIAAGFEFDGEISSGRLRHQLLPSFQFNTIEDAAGVAKPHRLSGDFQIHWVSPKNGRAPSAPDYALNMNVPYLDFESQGRLTVDPKTSTLRDGSVRISPSEINVQGDLDFNASQMLGVAPGPTELGLFLLPENSPEIQDFKISGRGYFSSKPGGWELGSSPGAANPLKLSLKLRQLELKPLVASHHLFKKKKLNANIHLEEASLELSDVKQIQYEESKLGGQTRGRLSRVDSGSVSLHHVKGSGSLWVNLMLMGLAEGIVPAPGILGGTTIHKSIPRPSSAPLTKHLPREAQQLLGDGDFFRIDKFLFLQSPNGEWTGQFNDLLFNFHEENGPFGMLRIPALRLHFEGKGVSSPKKLRADFGKGDFFVNIFLNDPKQGGFFRVVRWPEKS